MKIHIEKKLYIESDDMQYTIKEFTGKKDKAGNELFKTHGYHSSLNSAIKKIMKMKINESTAATLGELLDEVNRIEKWLDEKIRV